MRKVLALLTLFLIGCGLPPSTEKAGELERRAGNQSQQSLKSQTSQTNQTSEIQESHDSKPFRVPFVYPPGPCAMLFLYDDRLKDVLALPAAGLGMQNPNGANGEILFDRNGLVFRFSPRPLKLRPVLETLNLARFAFAPVLDEKGTLYFLATNDPAAAVEGIGDIAMLKKDCSLLSPESINAVGRLHGGITAFAPSEDGKWLTFTTKDEKLFMVDLTLSPPHACLTGIECADEVDISPSGRWVVWVDTRSHQLFLWDRTIGCIEPLTETAFLPAFLFSPLFVEEMIVYGALLPDQSLRVFAYDVR
ncbi:MAG: hypothetical protein ACM3YO_04280, partial [Bacteroidota bacterium]